MCCVSCLEAYSINKTVSANTPVPLDIRSIEKGEFASGNNNGTANIIFNKCGLYRVTVTASAVAGEAGDVSVQLYQDGVAIPNALSTVTAADTTNSRTISIEKLIQVSKNNVSCCPCSSPSTVSVMNVGVEATFDPINVTVVKIS